MSSRSNVLTNHLRQTAVLWANPVLDGFGGRTFDDGVEITCRWEQRQENFVDAQGRTVVSRTVVFVGQDLTVGDYLFLGTLADLDSGETDPETQSAAYEIRAFKSIPSMDATRFVRTAWL